MSPQASLVALPSWADRGRWASGTLNWVRCSQPIPGNCPVIFRELLSDPKVMDTLVGLGLLSRCLMSATPEGW